MQYLICVVGNTVSIALAWAVFSLQKIDSGIENQTFKYASKAKYSFLLSLLAQSTPEL